MEAVDVVVQIVGGAFAFETKNSRYEIKFELQKLSDSGVILNGLVLDSSPLSCAKSHHRF